MIGNLLITENLTHSVERTLRIKPLKAAHICRLDWTMSDILWA